MLSRLIVQSQPMISMALTGRTFQKLPIRNQIVRQLRTERKGRDTVTRAERFAQRQCLRKKIRSSDCPNVSKEPSCEDVLNLKIMTISFFSSFIFISYLSFILIDWVKNFIRRKIHDDPR